MLKSKVGYFTSISVMCWVVGVFDRKCELQCISRQADLSVHLSLLIGY